jgi:hypothetical protein
MPARALSWPATCPLRVSTTAAAASPALTARSASSSCAWGFQRGPVVHDCRLPDVRQLEVRHEEVASLRCQHGAATTSIHTPQSSIGIARPKRWGSSPRPAHASSAGRIPDGPIQPTTGALLKAAKYGRLT